MLLEPSIASPSRARAYCDGVLAEAGCASTKAADARLVVSELVTNAVVHAGTPIELTLVIREGVLRIEVTDLGVDRPQRWARDESSGRGLPIVEAVGTAWGVIDLGSSKTVWCEVALEPRESNGRV
jgi:anti-sigma regulatory factor (Ser/Thr protein kinase)